MCSGPSLPHAECGSAAEMKRTAEEAHFVWCDRKPLRSHVRTRLG
ncbi:unnamed protein product [Musa acuminata subsp. burmannicoides]